MAGPFHDVVDRANTTTVHFYFATQSPTNSAIFQIGTPDHFLFARMNVGAFSPSLLFFLWGLLSCLVFSLTYQWLGSSVFRTNTPDVKENNNFLGDGSSLWCTGHNKSTRVCKFRYLCYDPVQDEYLFFHGPETVIHGVPSNRFDPALLDMSSVEDHNTQYFNFVDYPAHALESFQNVTIFDEFNVIFHRFNPQNIMHVVHDDLLPLYHTMRQFSPSMLSADLEFRLVMMEGWDEGSYVELYKLFTKKQLVIKKDFEKVNNLACFRHGIIGISKYTTWYQYGFKEPQGALPHIYLTGEYIQHFTGFIRRRLALENHLSGNSDSSYVVLCSREHNRLIINELNLSVAIARQLNKQVIRISMATHSFKEQVQLISRADALIGMHGSLLIMGMFLPPGASLIELFPFGINPDNYTPYRTMVELPGMNLIYASWRNEIEENTVTYPHETPEGGGIDHLSEEEQVAIMNAKEIPTHFCCNNPYWLYRIYQDTVVDIQSFLSVVKSVQHQQKMLSVGQKSALKRKLYPSKVVNITCQTPLEEVQPALWLSWKPPTNLQFFETGNVKYEVWIQEVGRDDYLAFILDMTEYVFKDHLKRNTQYNVWIKCIFNERQGPFAMVSECVTH